jgi:hypothetical protein
MFVMSQGNTATSPGSWVAQRGMISGSVRSSFSSCLFHHSFKFFGVMTRVNIQLEPAEQEY